MQLKRLYGHFLQCTSVSTDTRTLLDGALFFALKGPRFDGNAMAAKALKAGANIVVLDNPDYATDERCIVVDDSLMAMQKLARFHRDRLDATVFGLTGSNGKTTTKELMVAVLKNNFNVSATPGNLNNHIGVPLTLLNSSSDTEILIVEMGTNQPGDIAQLCHIADPDIGLITNIGDTHLEKLNDRHGVFKDKRVLFDHIMEKKGTFFLNEDDAMLSEMVDHSRQVIRYSSKGAKDIQLRESTLPARTALGFHITYDGLTMKAESHLVGSYNLQNVSAALTVAMFYGVSIPQAVRAIESYVPTNMRSQEILTHDNRIIMDAYNANPSSVRTSLTDFLAAPGDDRIQVVILGDMLELGDRSPGFHREIADFLNLRTGLEVILVGPEFSRVKHPDMKSFEKVEQLKDHLIKNRITGADILLKGSRGIQLEKLLEVL